MATKSLLSRLFAGPIALQSKDMKAARLGATEQHPECVRIIWNGFKFYMRPAGDDDILTGVSKMGAYWLRLAYDPTATFKYWLSIADQPSEEQSVWWAFYLVYNEEGTKVLLKNLPQPYQSVQEASMALEVLHMDTINMSGYEDIKTIALSSMLVEQVPGSTWTQVYKEAENGFASEMGNTDLEVELEVEDLEEALAELL